MQLASAVSAALDDKNPDEIVDFAIECSRNAKTCGEITYSASVPDRAQLAIDYIKNNPSEQELCDFLYKVIGTGVLTSESVPTALALFYYCKEPRYCAKLCANLRGDTDTIAAMACAICWSYTDIKSIKNKVDFSPYVKQILSLKNKE